MRYEVSPFLPPTLPPTAPDRIPTATPTEPPAPQVPTSPLSLRHAEIPGSNRKLGDRTAQDNPVHDISRSATIPKVDMQYWSGDPKMLGEGWEKGKR